MERSHRLRSGLPRRLARVAPGSFSRRLRRPVFVVGFNNSGKSTVVRSLQAAPELVAFPGEGNRELWFPGYYPWVELDLAIPPLWYDPQRFIESVVASRTDGFQSARAELGAYQWISGARRILNDSGMLAPLLPDVVHRFPDAQVVHFVRDGRVAAYLSARRHWSLMQRSPDRYLEHGCSLRFRDVLQRVARYWVWTVERMDELARSGAVPVLRVSYEDWCADPGHVLRGITAFLGDDPSRITADPEPRTSMNPGVLAEFSDEEERIVMEVAGAKLVELGYA